MFVRIANDEVTNRPDIVTQDVHIAPGANLAVEAVLTGLDNTTSLNATSLDMQAQSSNRAFMTTLWRSLPDGEKACTNCSSVELAPLPDNAQRVKINVVLPPNVKAGLLYLASIPYFS